MQVISWKPEFKFAAKSGFSLIWFAKDAQVVSTKKKNYNGQSWPYCSNMHPSRNGQTWKKYMFVKKESNKQTK